MDLLHSVLGYDTLYVSKPTWGKFKQDCSTEMFSSAPGWTAYIWMWCICDVQSKDVKMVLYHNWLTIFENQLASGLFHIDASSTQGEYSLVY